jgi:RHS repeat-associated protein
VAGADGRPRAVPGRAGGTATGDRDPERVVVSGWQVYDNKGRVVEKYEPFFDTGWNYQPEEQARRGRRMAMFYDPRGQPIRTINPDGSQRRILFGVPSERSDPDRVMPTPWVTTVYDENDLAAHSTAPDGGSLAGRAPASHHDTPTLTVIDALGRTVCQLAQGGADPATDGHLTRTSYDVRGNVLTATDEHGRTAFANTYDLTDRPLRTTSIDGGAQAAVRDAAGNLIHSVDARECVTLRTYDQLNRLTAVYGRDRPGVGLSLREELTYGDEASDQTDALANYRLGRSWRHLDEAGLLVAETYDFAGRLTEQTRQVVSDAAIAAAEPAGWAANWATRSPESVLDRAVHRTSTRYDALGRPVEILAPTGAPGRRRRVVSVYGRSGALRSIAVGDEQRQSDPVPYVRRLSYNARGQRLLLAYGNGLMTRYGYDPDTFRLTRLRTETATMAGDVWIGSGPVLQDLTYGYDLVGNVTSIEQRTRGCGVAGTSHRRNRLVRTFGYDAFYRLTSATGRACADIGVPRPLDDTPRCGSYPRAPTQANAPDVTAQYRETYRYDQAGNLVDLLYQVTTGNRPRPRWHRRFGIGGLAADESARAPSNRLTSVANGSTVLPVGYDDVGNMISEGSSRSYSWDHAGRLVGFREGARAGASVAARYLYGADGIRVKKWVRHNGTGALDESTVYLSGLLEHHQWSSGSHTLLRVLDGTALIATVRDGPPRPREASPRLLYQLADHLGSGTLTVDDTGGWVNREEYFPYGETSFGGYARKRYRFTGKERDEESGLSYYGARYYAPPHCRWTTPDPAGPADGWNSYVYVRGNPLRYADDDGRGATEVDQKQQEVVNWAGRGAGAADKRANARNLEQHLSNLPRATPRQRTPTRSLVPGRELTFGPDLPDDFLNSGGFPMGGSPGPGLPNMGSRAGRGIGGVIDVIGLINDWWGKQGKDPDSKDGVKEKWKKFDKDWGQTWRNMWYDRSIRVIPGRTPGDMHGIEGLESSFEADRGGAPSPYRGKFLYVDELIARSQTPDELTAVRSFLTKAHTAWQTNRPEYADKAGLSILTLDRAQPITDDQLNEMLWHLDLKLDQVQRGAYRPPSRAGDYPAPSPAVAGRS